VEYAGQEFRTWESQKATKTDNAHLRFDYEGARGETVKLIGRIQRLLLHRMSPSGPERFVAECKWYLDVGTCPIAGTTMVNHDPSNPMNTDDKFVFLYNCYQRPVALWPNNPLGKIRPRDPAHSYMHVIDRNMQELV
jgi:hypothetical protein